MPTKMFINGCSFLTTRPKCGVHTHCGEELSRMMDLPIAENLAGGGRGNKRLMWTTRVWCEKFPNIAKDCFFVIGSSGGKRFDYPTGDGFKKAKFPTMETTWKTWDPNRDSNTESFFKYLFNKGLDIEQATQIESLLAIHDLQDFLKFRKYPYVMYNTLSDAEITNPDIKLMFDKIDRTRFFRPETSHIDYTVENKQHCAPGDPHPSTEGHKEWAEHLLKFIDANNLRTI